MTAIRDIVYYIKSLKKGFDKDLFQSKVEELAYIVDSGGLDYNGFHTLFQVWLNLSIPITKWISLGACLVPREKINNETVEYAIAWLLSNYGNQAAFPRMGFVFDWLTAAMDCEHIDINDLDMGYDLFYSTLTYEVLTPHVMKLVYTLTKPTDVTRENVVELLNFAKKREAKKNMFRQLQVLLGLFKSYRPECVPEDIPAISVHTSFKKVNPTLMERFRKCQENHNSTKQDKQYLLWINPINSERGRNKKLDLLVPNIEFTNVGVKRNADREQKKTHLDFSDAASLLQYSLQHSMSRPAKLRSLLCNDTGLVLLATASDSEQAFFSHDLHHLLTSTFLDVNVHSPSERSLLLRRVSALQRSTLQGAAPSTRLLARWLPLWDPAEHFHEVLELVEWVSLDSLEYVSDIVESLSRVCHLAAPIQQCAILRSLTNMYSNIVYSCTRRRQHFLCVGPARGDLLALLAQLATAINQLCDKALQAAPDDLRLAYSSLRCAHVMSAAHAQHGLALQCAAQRLAPLLGLVAASTALLDLAAGTLMLQKKLRSLAKSQNVPYDEDLLKSYIHDVINCLYNESCFVERTGLYFNKLRPQLVEKLNKIMPNASAELSIRNSAAFAPYTYVELGAIDHEDATNKLWFEAVVEPEFTNLSKLLKTALPELRT